MSQTIEQFKAKWYHPSLLTQAQAQERRKQQQEQREDCSYASLPYIKQACRQCDCLTLCHGNPND